MSAYFRGFIICTPKICTPKNIQVMREMTIVNLRTRTHLLTQALPYNLSIMLIVISKDRATPQCNPRNFFSDNPAKILHDFTINILVEWSRGESRVFARPSLGGPQLPIVKEVSEVVTYTVRDGLADHRVSRRVQRGVYPATAKALGPRGSLDPVRGHWCCWRS